MKEATRKDVHKYHLAAGVVSSGRGDPGGISNVAYRLSPKKRIIQSFLKEGAAWVVEFHRLDPTKKGYFGSKWELIAKEKAKISLAHNMLTSIEYTMRELKRVYCKERVSHQYMKMLDIFFKEAIKSLGERIVPDLNMCLRCLMLFMKKEWNLIKLFTFRMEPKNTYFKNTLS